MATNQSMRSVNPIDEYIALEKEFRKVLSNSLNSQANRTLTQVFVRTSIERWNQLLGKSKKIDSKDTTLHKQFEDELTEAYEVEFEDYLDEQIEDSTAFRQSGKYDNELYKILRNLAIAGIISGIIWSNRKLIESAKDSGAKVETIDGVTSLEFSDGQKIDGIKLKDIDLRNQAVLDFINTYTAELVVEISNTSRERIKNYLKQMIYSGKSQNEIVNQISRLHKINDRRATTIVRNELASIKQFQQRFWLEKINNVQYWQWTCASPDDQICLVACGSIRKIGESFPNGLTEPLAHINKFSTDTFLFTQDGWKQSTEVTRNDLFLSLTKDYQIEYVKADIITQSDYSVWHHYKGKLIDILVTEDHQLCIISDWDMQAHNKRWKLIQSKEINSNTFYIPKTTRQISKPIESKYKLDLAKLYGVYVGDGSIQSNGILTISQRKHNNPHWEDVYKTCSKHWDTTYTDDLIRVSVDRNTIDELKSLGICYYKYIPDWIKNGSHELIRSFLDGLLITDGYVANGNEIDGYKCRDTNLYFTTSKRLVSDLTYCLLKIGKGVSYSQTKLKKFKIRGKEYKNNYPCWVVYELKSFSNMIDKKKHLTIINEKRTGIGITLEKNHTLFAMRNNKTYWIGNCQCYTEAIFDFDNFNFSNYEVWNGE